MNMPYVSITLDVEVAIKAYKVIWNLLEKISNVVIRLGDFHYMRENFQVSFCNLYFFCSSTTVVVF